MMRPAVLTCHPSTPTDLVRRLVARVTRTAGALRFTFVLDADLSGLRLPGPRPPRITPRLWEHTCFEAFVAGDGPAYHEFNFAPSGEWAVHAFRGYRDGGPVDDESLAPTIVARCRDGGFELDAVVSLDRLSPAHVRAPLRLALATVIEAADGALSYWALAHPAGAPDFHHADGFALRVEPVGGAW
jgi:hypothetical protein